MTDIERDETLDALTSEELERQAFGPAPRRSLRGLIDRPTSGAVSHRVRAPKRRWPTVLAIVVAGVVAFAAVDLAMGTGGGPDVFIMADGPDEVAVPVDDAPFEIDAQFDEEMEALEEAVEVEVAVPAEVDALFASLGDDPSEAQIAAAMDVSMEPIRAQRARP